MKRNILFLFIFSSLVAKEIWQGDYYQHTSRPQYEMANYVLQRLPHQDFKTIFDIGCGSGEVTAQMGKKADYVLGVDYSKSMIVEAQKLYGSSNNVQFLVADITNLSSINTTFDLITCFHTIQWIDSNKQSMAFEQMAAHLNPNGLCVLLVSHKDNVFYESLITIARLPKWKNYFPVVLEPWNWQTVESIDQSFRLAGLIPTTIEVWYKDYYFKDKESFYKFMANWFYSAAHFRYIPESEQETFFDEILTKFLDSMSYQSGPVTFKSPFVLGMARKGECVVAEMH